ncbi:DNA-binding protein [Pedobacter sp. Leaf216]|uniref:helix-turn-helix domain-containing protein n=1 Tax=Pedobacter sp. Leaf216 TaxID=1735684 RepID=UPI0007022060|nr:helix-turn-helix domain-containing protein [Pedobacter sp. Leaf216]KQM71451.1 DNA-binding protein [Pedobacter sp. Leaf216]
MKTSDEYNGYRIPVPAEFDELISHFYFAENKSSNPIIHTFLPTFQSIMVFNFGAAISLITKEKEEISMDKCLVLGPVKQAFTYVMPPGGEMLVVNFKDDAFFRFFGTASLIEHVHPDDLLNDNCFTMLWESLSKMDQVSDKVTQLLQFSKLYIQNRHPLTEQIIAFGNSAVSPVKQIADQQKISERSLQMKAKNHLGYSSKEIGRYMRFLKAVELVQQLTVNNNDVNWFVVIERCGFYDQSQLIHDFKHYLDLSPSRYLKFQQGICNSRS